MKDKNVYGSGLNEDDWKALRDVIWPFIHKDDPTSIEIPRYPKHLSGHPVITSIEKYKNTKEEKYLDEAGNCLIPTNESFGWYVPLTK